MHYLEVMRQFNYVILKFLEIYHEYSDELILETHVRGEPKPKIEWLRGGLFLKSDGKYLIKHKEDGTVQLLIANPTRWDSGKYVVRATNRVSEAELKYHLSFKENEDELVANIEHKKKNAEDLKKLRKSKYIKEADWLLYGDSYVSPKKSNEKQYDNRYKLKFITHLTDQIVPTGSVLSLKCFVEGSYPQYAWFKEDMPIVHGRKYFIKAHKDGKVELDVRNTTKDDAGQYKLICKNYAGEIETKAKVTVYENPLQKVDPPRFVGAMTGSIVLCTVSRQFINFYFIFNINQLYRVFYSYC